jgi:hypothetical protein
LFRDAVKAVTRRDDEEPKPQARRRSGETEKGFSLAARRILRRAAAGSYVAASTWLADTLDWLRLWDDNAEAENLNGFDNEFKNSDTSFTRLEL